MLQISKYVRVYGHVRDFDGKKSVTAFTVKPIIDYDEVSDLKQEDRRRGKKVVCVCVCVCLFV